MRERYPTEEARRALTAKQQRNASKDRLLHKAASPSSTQQQNTRIGCSTRPHLNSTAEHKDRLHKAASPSSTQQQNTRILGLRLLHKAARTLQHSTAEHKDTRTEAAPQG
jgi:hypothetical protein